MEEARALQAKGNLSPERRAKGERKARGRKPEQPGEWGASLKDAPGSPFPSWITTSQKKVISWETAQVQGPGLRKVRLGTGR